MAWHMVHSRKREVWRRWGGGSEGSYPRGKARDQTPVVLPPSPQPRPGTTAFNSFGHFSFYLSPGFKKSHFHC